MRRSRCFVFDEQLRVCEVLTSQNQSVQLRLNMYMSPRPPALLWAFSKGYGCKDSDNFDKSYQKNGVFFMKAMFFRFLFVFVDI